MKKIYDDVDAGVYGVFVMMAVLGLAAFMWLIFNSFMGIAFEMMDESYTASFFELVWADGGLLVVIFIVSVVSAILYMQRSKYSFYGGGGFS